MTFELGHFGPMNKIRSHRQSVIGESYCAFTNTNHFKWPLQLSFIQRTSRTLPSTAFHVYIFLCSGCVHIVHTHTHRRCYVRVRAHAMYPFIGRYIFNTEAQFQNIERNLNHIDIDADVAINFEAFGKYYCKRFNCDAAGVTGNVD